MSELQPGWYWIDGMRWPFLVRVSDASGAKPLYQMAEPDRATSKLPRGWTLGPRIEDAVRDAARYRQLRHKARTDIDWIVTQGVVSTSDADFDAAVDAEIAREAGKKC